MNPSPALAELIEIVASDADLRHALALESSTDTFAAACATLAEKHRLRVTPDEVRELLRAWTIQWHQRDIL